MLQAFYGYNNKKNSESAEPRKDSGLRSINGSIFEHGVFSRFAKVISTPLCRKHFFNGKFFCKRIPALRNS